MYMNIAGANLATTWTHDLGGFYGRPPYSQCPPDDPNYSKRCREDPRQSGCNVNSCMPAGCKASPGNVTTAGLCMHDPELHLRWLQQGALSHVFRTHCEACEVRPWMFPGGFPELMFRAYHLRAALLPYIYTSAWQSTRTGVLTMHPLYYEWPEEEEAYTSSRFVFDNHTKTNPLNVVSRPLQYLFGPAFMVAPVQVPATVNISVGSSETQTKAGTMNAAGGRADDAASSTVVMTSNFTMFTGDWCGQGVCMHQTPIGGIQPTPNYEACEARCEAIGLSAQRPCLSFDFQSGRCYLWSCYALLPAPNADTTTVCGNRSRSAPLPPTPPTPPPAPHAPTPVPTPAPPLPPPKKAVGIALQDVWIPPGQWVHWQSGAMLSGPRLYRQLNFSLADIPFYARLGAVVPAKDADQSAVLAPDPLVLVVLAGPTSSVSAVVASNGTCQVYEDDGQSTGYLSQQTGAGADSHATTSQGLFWVTEVAHTTTVGPSVLAAVRVTPRAIGTGYEGAPFSRGYRVEYRNGGRRPSVVTVNGTAVPEHASGTPGTGWWMRPPCKEVTCTYNAAAIAVNWQDQGGGGSTLVQLQF
jgi:hypothetical protein